MQLFKFNYNAVADDYNDSLGLEIAVSSNDESNSVSKIFPRSQLSGNFEKSRLVNSIEAIHAQLKMKLMESRKIISGKGLDLPKSPLPCRYAEKSSSISSDLSKDLTGSESFEENAEKLRIARMSSSKACAKPRIVNDERVHIKLDRFRIGSNPRRTGGGGESGKTTVVPSTSKVTTETVTNAPDQNEDMVEMLSKEILEQSKSINKSVAIDSLKDSDDSILKSSKIVEKDPGESDDNAVTNDNNQSINLDVRIVKLIFSANFSELFIIIFLTF
jgi:hypothetical protein